MTTQPLVNPAASLAPAPQSPPQVVLENLVKEYGTLRALNGVSFDIQAGEWIALMGPSGSGKTTLINILGGLDTATSGRVTVNGQDITRLGESDLVRYRAEKIGFVFQQFHLVPYQAVESLKRVGLGDRLEHLPSKLSGGEQQRVAIARALINQPKLILADEPTGNLDEANEGIVINIFRELHQAGHTILMVTHDVDIARNASRRIELTHGHLTLDTTCNFLEQPKLCPHGKPFPSSGCCSTLDSKSCAP